MIYTWHYKSPMGDITMAGEEYALTGLWFDGQKYFAAGMPEECAEEETPVFKEVRRWLDTYFDGKKPDFTPPLSPQGSPFRLAVWDILLKIPYGETITYGKISEMMAKKTGRYNMSAQAVGGAVGHNPISIIIPCHRVVGTNGSLTGYAGGIDRKIGLLVLEKADMTGLFIPKRGTAL